jgi:thiamine pyrophosphokinase
MHFLVVAGGSADDLPADVSALGAFDAVIAADGGARNARRMGLAPDVVVGDLDSLDSEERGRLQAAGCRFQTHAVAKDETDLELALLWCRDQGATDISILGAFGGRPDHLLANILLLTDHRFKGIAMRLHGRSWEMWLAQGEATILGRPGDTVSLIPLSPRVSGVVSDGLLYPLRSEALRRGQARGVSNVMLGSQAHVRFGRGLLLVIHGPAQQPVQA